MVPPEMKKSGIHVQHLAVGTELLLPWTWGKCQMGGCPSVRMAGQESVWNEGSGCSTAWAPWASHSTAETIESQKTPQAGFTFQEGCNFTAGLGAK